MHRETTNITMPMTHAVERDRNPHSESLRIQDQGADIAAYLLHERAALIKRVLNPPHDAPPSAIGLSLAHAFSDLMDAVITRLFFLACQRVGVCAETLPIAIIATGGYGRRELCPRSDIDITFVPKQDGDPRNDLVMREMFTQIMDICIGKCGLDVGYAYRLFEDCASLDHLTTSGLLDARLIAGDERLFIRFEDAFWAGFNSTDFIFNKVEERSRALAKWGSSPRVVEPHLKEGPGGMRDLQTAVWLVQAREQLAAARVRGSRSIAALAMVADIGEEDAARLAAAKEMLFRVRNALHAATGAEQDTLVATRQEQIAALLGYGDLEKETLAKESKGDAPDEAKRRSAVASDADVPPIERFMAELYPHLANIRRISSQVIYRIENSRLLLGIGLDCRRRRIVPANGALDTDDPVWLLWACEMAQKYGLELSVATQNAAIALVGMNPILPEKQHAAQVFTRIMRPVGRIYPILQEMADTGILGWYIPEFQSSLDLIPYDPAHQFTVGQHTLHVIRTLEELMTVSSGEELLEMRRMLLDLPNPEQLMLAALLHDTGKGAHDRPHAEVGAEIAVQVCRRLGWSPEAEQNVVFLVRHHLLMAETSRLRDLNLDETIREFTQVVDDTDRLTMLYLLTYADTRSVGEGVWTQVTGRFLRDLWGRAFAALTENVPAEFEDARIDRTRRRLQKDLTLENLPDAESAEHIQSMPPHYLLNQEIAKIALHIGFVRRVREGRTVIDFHSERNAAYTEMIVCTYDDPQPGLLAKIASALYAADLTVHSAQVVTRISDLDRIALDTLWVDFKGRPLSPVKQKEVERLLTEVLQGTRTTAEILARRKPKTFSAQRKTTAVKTSAASEAGASSKVTVHSVHTELSTTMTVVEVCGLDTSGTLYWSCEALSSLGWDIQSARLSRWQGMIRASFYIPGIRSLREEQVREKLEAAVIAVAGNVSE